MKTEISLKEFFEEGKKLEQFSGKGYFPFSFEAAEAIYNYLEENQPDFDILDFTAIRCEFAEYEFSELKNMFEEEIKYYVEDNCIYCDGTSGSNCCDNEAKKYINNLESFICELPHGNYLFFNY